MVIRRSSLFFSLIALAVCLAGCAAHEEHHEESHGESPAWAMTGLSIRLDRDATDIGDEILGWIYAQGNIDGEPNRCIYIFRDKSWMMADETTPGFYDSNKVSGSFSMDEDEGWVSSSFPAISLENYRNVYSTGHFSAVVGDRAIVRNR